MGEAAHQEAALAAAAGVALEVHHRWGPGVAMEEVHRVAAADMEPRLEVAGTGVRLEVVVTVVLHEVALAHQEGE